MTTNYIFLVRLSSVYTLKKKVLQGFFAEVMVLYSTTKPRSSVVFWGG